MRRAMGTVCGMVAWGACAAAAWGEPLVSWNDGAAKRAIVSFVQRVTTEGGPDYVRAEERVAVFDNDGTLWCEQPMYAQLAFALDRVKAMSAEHPEWATTEPFASALKGDVHGALAGGEKAILDIVTATHAGMTTEEFEGVVSSWISTARHPETGLLYTEMVYRPMVELLGYLREHGFATYIVSGGGVEFMRPWAEAVYGIPPERVIGSRIAMRFEVAGGAGGEPRMVREPRVVHVNDGPEKPVGIQQAIGRRPILAVGNSDGDRPMLEWTTMGGSGARAGAQLGVLVHHTDGEREWAYDRESKVGRLNGALDAADERGWVVVDMRTDWATVFGREITRRSQETPQK